MNLASPKPTIDQVSGEACGKFHLRSMWKARIGQLARTVPQASPRHPPDPPRTQHAFRSDLAQAEGWDVFDCSLREDGTPRVEIQRLDSVAPGQPRFRTDGATWEHVVAQALEGSTLHLAALAMLDPTEQADPPVVPHRGAAAVSRQSRREVGRGSCSHKQVSTPTASPSEPPPSRARSPPSRARSPRFLGSWQWRQPTALERTTDWLDRTGRQREQLVAVASSWLQVSQAVRVNGDPRVGGDMAGQTGIVHRLCRPAFADYTTVGFPPRGREKVPRLRMLPLEILEPVE